MRLSGHHSRSRVNGQEIQKKGSFIIGFLGCLLNWLSGSCLDTGCHSPTSSLLTESLWWQFSQIKPGVYLFQSRYCDSSWQWLIQHRNMNLFDGKLGANGLRKLLGRFLGSSKGVQGGYVLFSTYHSLLSDTGCCTLKTWFLGIQEQTAFTKGQNPKDVSQCRETGRREWQPWQWETILDDTVELLTQPTLERADLQAPHTMK